MTHTAPFALEHLALIDVQESQRDVMVGMTPDLAAFAAAHPSIALLDGEAVAACGGVLPPRGPLGWCAWMICGSGIAAHALALVRVARRLLDLFADRDVEALIYPNDAKAARFARALSFEIDDEFELPDGALLHVYVRRARR